MKNKDKAYWLAKKAKAEQKIKELDKPVDGFRVIESGHHWMAYLKDGKYQFGISVLGYWINEFGIPFDPNTDCLATESEVTERLTEFVKSLGYEEGVTTLDLCDNLSKRTLSPDSLEFGLNNSFGYYYICLGFYTIWRSDKGWAKIVETKPKYTVEPTVFGYEDNEVKSDFRILKDGKILLMDCEETAKRIETFLNSEQC